MNSEETFPSSGPQPGKAGFCQQCGTPLTEQTRRSVGGAVYCEPCLAARIAGPFPADPVRAQYVPTAPGAIAPPSSPNPRLAALLGFIPGVGAMYNEQYAKGIAHLAIFALLVVLKDANGIFGLFIVGWEFYMVTEAFHTARARLEGTPLPNPFGFNDLGDRLGFMKGWTAPGRAQSSQAPYVAPGPPASHTGPSAPPVSYPETAQPGYAWTAPPQPGWTATPQPGAGQPYPHPVVAYQGVVDTRVTGDGVLGSGVVGPVAVDPVPPFPPIDPLGPVSPVTLRSRFPAGAVWLILLGVVFLLSTTGLFHEFSGEALLGWSLIGLAGWLFFRRFRERRADPQAPMRFSVRGLEWSVWLLTSGILALLDAGNLLGWEKSWPIFLIVAGVVALLGRAAVPQQLRREASPTATAGTGSDQTP